MEAHSDAPAKPSRGRTCRSREELVSSSVLRTEVWGGFLPEPASCHVSELVQPLLSLPLHCGIHILFPLYIFMEINLRKIPLKVTFDLGVPSGLIA